MISECTIVSEIAKDTNGHEDCTEEETAEESRAQ